MKAKVAAVIDEFSIAINAGLVSGVERNMIFTHGGEGHRVIDPETNDTIGWYESPTLVLRVTHVDNEFSILETTTHTWGRVRHGSLPITFVVKVGDEVVRDMKREL